MFGQLENFLVVGYLKQRNRFPGRLFILGGGPVKLELNTKKYRAYTASFQTVPEEQNPTLFVIAHGKNVRKSMLLQQYSITPKTFPKWLKATDSWLLLRVVTEQSPAQTLSSWLSISLTSRNDFTKYQGLGDKIKLTPLQHDLFSEDLSWTIAFDGEIFLELDQTGATKQSEVANKEHWLKVNLPPHLTLQELSPLLQRIRSLSSQILDSIQGFCFEGRATRTKMLRGLEMTTWNVFEECMYICRTGSVWRNETHLKVFWENGSTIEIAIPQNIQPDQAVIHGHELILFDQQNAVFSKCSLLSTADLERIWSNVKLRVGTDVTANEGSDTLVLVPLTNALKTKESMLTLAYSPQQNAYYSVQVDWTSMYCKIMFVMQGYLGPLYEFDPQNSAISRDSGLYCLFVCWFRMNVGDLSTYEILTYTANLGDDLEDLVVEDHMTYGGFVQLADHLQQQQVKGYSVVTKTCRNLRVRMVVVSQTASTRVGLIYHDGDTFRMVEKIEKFAFFLAVPTLSPPTARDESLVVSIIRKTDGAHSFELHTISLSF